MISPVWHGSDLNPNLLISCLTIQCLTCTPSHSPFPASSTLFMTLPVCGGDRNSYRVWTREVKFRSIYWGAQSPHCSAHGETRLLTLSPLLDVMLWWETANNKGLTDNYSLVLFFNVACSKLISFKNRAFWETKFKQLCSVDYVGLLNTSQKRFWQSPVQSSKFPIDRKGRHREQNHSQEKERS